MPEEVSQVYTGGQTVYRMTEADWAMLWECARARVALKKKHRIRNRRVDRAKDEAWTWMKGLLGEYTTAWHGFIPFNPWDHRKRGDGGIDLWSHVAGVGWVSMDCKTIAMKGGPLTVKDGRQWSGRDRLPLKANYAVLCEYQAPRLVKVVGQIEQNEFYRLARVWTAWREPYPLYVRPSQLQEFALFDDGIKRITKKELKNGTTSRIRKSGQ